MEAALMQTKDQVAARLAETHYLLEGGIRHIFRSRAAAEDALAEPIKLLDVFRA